MKLKVNRIDGNWQTGMVGDYWFQAKVFDEPSEFGINDGRVSKLSVRKDGEEIMNYDRGWDIKPKTDTERELLDTILKYYA